MAQHIAVSWRTSSDPAPGQTDQDGRTSDKPGSDEPHRTTVVLNECPGNIRPAAFGSPAPDQSKDGLSNYRTVRGADGYLKAQQTDLSTAAGDLEERGLQGKTRKTELPALPDVDPSSKSISQIIREIESVQNALNKATFSTE
jgi:hypothetical protein